MEQDSGRDRQQEKVGLPWATGFDFGRYRSFSKGRYRVTRQDIF